MTVALAPFRFIPMKRSNRMIDYLGFESSELLFNYQLA